MQCMMMPLWLTQHDRLFLLDKSRAVRLGFEAGIILLSMPAASPKLHDEVSFNRLSPRRQYRLIFGVRRRTKQAIYIME